MATPAKKPRATQPTHTAANDNRPTPNERRKTPTPANDNVRAPGAGFDASATRPQHERYNEQLPEARSGATIEYGPRRQSKRENQKNTRQTSRGTTNTTQQEAKTTGRRPRFLGRRRRLGPKKQEGSLHTATAWFARTKITAAFIGTWWAFFIIAAVQFFFALLTTATALFIYNGTESFVLDFILSTLGAEVALNKLLMVGIVINLFLGAINMALTITVLLPGFPRFLSGDGTVLKWILVLLMFPFYFWPFGTNLIPWASVYGYLVWIHPK